MIYIKAKYNDKVTILDRFGNNELFLATKALVLARRKHTRSFVYLEKGRAGK